MSQLVVAPVRNRLLNALPPEVLAAFLPKLTRVDLRLREVLVPSGGVAEAAYFPETGMLSLVATLDDGIQAEVGVIGFEGAFGVGLMAGIDTTFTEVIVQLPGRALRIGAAEFRQEIEENAVLRRLMMRYGEALQAQVMQTAACNNHHGLEQRLVRWLLLARDRAESDEMQLTQEFMAMMLGVHRPSVTVTAGILQRAGLIRYSGGRMTLVDRPGLEGAACECYGVVRRRYEAVLGIAPS